MREARSAGRGGQAAGGAAGEASAASAKSQKVDARKILEVCKQRTSLLRPTVSYSSCYKV
jgi:hypothetical protein